MLRLLPWSSGLAADKISPQEMNYLVPQRYRSPAIDLHKPPILKRKRATSPSRDQPQHPSKHNVENMAQGFLPAQPVPTQKLPPALTQAINEGSVPPTLETWIPAQPKMEDMKRTHKEDAKSRPKPDQGTLKRTIDSQISLEILLKHNELRLIDQEIAKCQIALEQLRRCAEIPYPVVNPSESVSKGRGPTIRPSRSAAQAESPAPWGVVDGPYTRHYAKWLLPHPLFDGGDRPGVTGLKILGGETPPKGRSTRGSFAESSTSTVKSKAQRATKFQALSSGYPQAKDKAGPMIQRRKSDGSLVKLVCLDCRRDNFSSAQGFINHCRIAHGRSFASHEAAADACGEAVDVDEAGALVGSEGPPSTSVAGLVHPLIYSAHTLKPDICKKTPTAGSTARNNNASSDSLPRPKRSQASEQQSSSKLTPSPLTPNLSNLLRTLGASIDLRSLVADVKSPVAAEESSESEDEEEEDSKMSAVPPLTRHPHALGSTQPAHSNVRSVPSDETRKGLRGPHILHSSSAPTRTPPVQALPRNVAPTTFATAVPGEEVEPSPTNDSNQAPSLVDDDGEDEYDAHSPSYSGSGSIETDNQEVDFEIEDGDGDGEESGPSTRNRSTDADYSSSPKQHSTVGRASAFRRSINSREEKHVSFVSPSPGREVEPSRNGGDRKRRRTGNG